MAAAELRMTTAKARAGIFAGSMSPLPPPKYFSQRASSTFAPALYLTNLKGPAPIGFLPKSMIFWAAAIWSNAVAPRAAFRSLTWVSRPWP